MGKSWASPHSHPVEMITSVLRSFHIMSEVCQCAELSTLLRKNGLDGNFRDGWNRRWRNI